MYRTKNINASTIEALHTEHLKQLVAETDLDKALDSEIEYILNAGKVLIDYHDSSVSNNILTLDSIMDDRQHSTSLFNEYVKHSGMGVYKQSKSPICEACGSTDVVINNDDMQLHCATCAVVQSIPVDVNTLHAIHMSGTMQIGCSDNGHIHSKRRSHLSDWLMTIQGYKLIDIKQDVYEAVYRELVKMRYVSDDLIVLRPDKITVSCILDILKLCRMGKHYDSAAFIRTKITGLSSAFLTAEVESKIKTLFDIIADSYEKYKRTIDGKNLTSYAFIIRKLLEMVGDTSNIEYFRLVKSKTKLNEYNAMWKNICESHGFVYKPSY